MDDMNQMQRRIKVIESMMNSAIEESIRLEIDIEAKEAMLIRYPTHLKLAKIEEALEQAKAALDGLPGYIEILERKLKEAQDADNT